MLDNPDVDVSVRRRGWSGSRRTNTNQGIALVTRCFAGHAAIDERVAADRNGRVRCWAADRDEIARAVREFTVGGMSEVGGSGDGASTGELVNRVV